MARCQGCGFQHYDVQGVGNGTNGPAGTDLCIFCGEICRKAQWSAAVLSRLATYLGTAASGIVSTGTPVPDPLLAPGNVGPSTAGQSQQRQSTTPGGTVNNNQQYTG